MFGRSATVSPISLLVLRHKLHKMLDECQHKREKGKSTEHRSALRQTRSRSWNERESEAQTLSWIILKLFACVCQQLFAGIFSMPRRVRNYRVALKWFFSKFLSRYAHDDVFFFCRRRSSQKKLLWTTKNRQKRFFQRWILLFEEKKRLKKLLSTVKNFSDS